VSAEPPVKLTGSGRRSGVDTSVTFNRRQQAKAINTAAASVSVDGGKASETGSATRSRGRSTREPRKQAATTSTPEVETVKRKISSEWDDCMHFCFLHCFIASSELIYTVASYCNS